MPTTIPLRVSTIQGFSPPRPALSLTIPVVLILTALCCAWLATARVRLSEGTPGVEAGCVLAEVPCAQLAP